MVFFIKLVIMSGLAKILSVKDSIGQIIQVLF